MLNNSKENFQKLEIVSDNAGLDSGGVNGQVSTLLFHFLGISKQVFDSCL